MAHADWGRIHWYVEEFDLWTNAAINYWILYVAAISLAFFRLARQKLPSPEQVVSIALHTLSFTFIWSGLFIVVWIFLEQSTVVGALTVGFPFLNALPLKGGAFVAFVFGQAIGIPIIVVQEIRRSGHGSK